MQRTSSAQSRTRAAAHHRKRPIAKRPWHKSVLLCCFAGANKEEDVDDPMEPAAAPAGANNGLSSATGSATAVVHTSAASRPAASITPVDVPLLKAEGPTTNLLDDPVTDHSLPLFESSSGTADARVAPRDLNLGSPLISPSTSHVALEPTAAAAAAAAAAAGLTSCHEMSSAEDLVPDSSSSNSRIVGPAASLTAKSAVSPAPQQQHQYNKEGSPFLNQQHQSHVTAELLGMQMQMQQYLVQHPEAEQSYQQQRASYEEQHRSKPYEQQQQQQRQGSKRLAPAGAPAGAAAANGSSAGDAALPALFSRNVAGWDSDLSTAAAADTDLRSSAIAGVEPSSSNDHANWPDSNVSTAAAPAAVVAPGGASMLPQQQQKLNSHQPTDVNSSRDQVLKQTAGMPPRSPSLPKMLSEFGNGGSSSGALPAGWYSHNSSSTPAVINYAVGVSNHNPDLSHGNVQGLGEAKGLSHHKFGLKPLSHLKSDRKSEQSDDSSPFQQQRLGGDQSYSVVPVTGGMPPLSPIRIPSNTSHNSLLKLIGHSGAFDADLDESPQSPQSPRMSVVGVSNSVIDNFLSEEGIPLVPTEPGLAESIMDPVPETLELTPETPKRVRSFLSSGGSSGSRRQWGSVPGTPRVSSGTSGVLPGGTSGDAALAGAWSGTGGDQDGTQGGTSPLRAGQVVRGYKGQRQLVSGTRGGIVSESNIVKGNTCGYNGSAYRRRSNAAAGSSIGDEVSSWDDPGVGGLRSGCGSSSSRKIPIPPAAAGRVRRGSSSYYEVAATPRANRVSLSFSEMQRPRIGTSSSNMFNRASLGAQPAAAAAVGGGGDFILLDADSASGSVTQASAVANADADVAVEDLPGSDLDMFAADADEDLGMSAAHIAAAASFTMSPPDNPNPSHANNIVDWFEPMTTSMTPRGSQTRRYSIAELQDFGPESFGGGGSSSSGRGFESGDRGFGSSVGTSNVSGSGALYSRSGMADLAKDNKGIGASN